MPGRQWPCLVPERSCKDYTCFGLEAPTCSEAVMCDENTLSVTKVTRKGWADCLLEASALLGYFELLATAIILAVYLTCTKGPTWFCNADTRKQYVATATEATE